MSKILLQTTIPFTEDDWHIGRFSLLREYLRSITDSTGRSAYEVIARDHDPGVDDAILSTLDESDFDQLWLFAVDTGNGLSQNDCEGISRFRQRGGAIYSTRDHQDLGSSLCSIGGIGAAHYFHSHNPDPDESRLTRDDTDNPDIDYPNYHSGSNGDFQRIQAIEPVHELLRQEGKSTIELFPAHPHEGSVGVPSEQAAARVIATGTSQTTGRIFNLIVVFDRDLDENGNMLGRGVAESSFHHFVDYNWDTTLGCPSFLTDPPGDGIKRNPAGLDDVKAYVENLARWLGT